jgi:hypothetical protein
MSTSIEARQARALNYQSFAHITSTPLVAFDSNGLLFDGTLTDTEIGDVWWYATSADDTDQAKREELAALIAEAEAKPYNENTKWLTDAWARLARYQIRLGET